MPEWTIKDENGNESTVKFPKYVSARHGRKAFNKLDVKMKGGNISVEDMDTLVDAKNYLVKNMLERTGASFSADNLAMESWNKIANYYFDQVMDANKKKES